MITNLIGRWACGEYQGINPTYNANLIGSPYSVMYKIEGEIVATTASTDGLQLHFWVLDAYDGQVRRCLRETCVILPRDREIPLR